MPKSLRLLVLALILLLPAVAVMPEMGAAEATAMERPTLAVARGVFRAEQLAWVAQNLRADVTTEVVFLSSFKLGATRRSTAADYDMSRYPRLPRIGSSVTPVSGEFEVRTWFMAEYGDEQRKYCWTRRITITGGTFAAILYKRNGKWVQMTPPHRWNKTREVKKGFC